MIASQPWLSSNTVAMHDRANRVSCALLCQVMGMNNKTSTCCAWMTVLLIAVSLAGSGCRRTTAAPAVDFPYPDVPNYQGLVSVRWVKQLIDHEQTGAAAPKPETYEQERFVILEASWAPLEEAKDYLAGHLPGAIHFNTDLIENGYPQWRLKEIPELQQVLGQSGITPTTTVVIYSEKLIAAARIWWVCKYAGVHDVRIMDGGIDAWRAAGYPLEHEISQPVPTEFQGPAQLQMLATTDYVKQRMGDKSMLVADVRSRDEFVGRTSGYSYLDAKGRIPAAVHLGDADDDAHHYLLRTGHLRSPSDLLTRWQAAGIELQADHRQFEQEVVFYCGGGWRSSVSYFYAWLMGFDNIRNYSDGWSGWSTNYQPDEQAKGNTPGWKQVPTGNPIVSGQPTS